MPPVAGLRPHPSVELWLYRERLGRISHSLFRCTPSSRSEVSFALCELT